MTKPKRLMEVTYQPHAECAEESCDWGHAPSAGARDGAKFHSEMTGHDVRVITETVSLYGVRS